MKTRILVTPTTYGARPLELLKQAGHEITVNPFGRRMTSDEVVRLGDGCVGIIAGVEPLNAGVLEALPLVRCISRCGVGVDNIDLDKAQQLGITVRNTPDAPTRAVAELTVGVILDVLRGVSYCDRGIRNGNWRKVTGALLLDKRVGVLGLGRIGRAVAKLLAGLGAEVAGADPKPDVAWLEMNRVSLLSLQDLLRESDILCIHMSYSAVNRHMIGRKELEAMKTGAYLVNMSRGDIVDEAALYEALTGGRLAGAALDVFEQEPYTGRLRELDNVVLTPHIGSYTVEARLAMELEAVSNLLEGLGSTAEGK